MTFSLEDKIVPLSWLEIKLAPFDNRLALANRVMLFVKSIQKPINVRNIMKTLKPLTIEGLLTDRQESMSVAE